MYMLVYTIINKRKLRTTVNILNNKYFNTLKNITQRGYLFIIFKFNLKHIYLKFMVM